MKINLLELHPDEFKELLLRQVDKKFRIKQLLNWIYVHRILDPDLMSNIPADFKTFLKKEFSNFIPRILDKQISQDSSTKYLLELEDENRIEMVIIPREGRTTLCLSSQVGCARNCLFCATAKIGLIRNLYVHEILSQVFITLKELQDRKLTNIVFMGMGEPLDNYENVLKSIRILQHEEGFKFSPRRITLSTSGVIPRLNDLADSNLKVKLAVSLNSAIQEKRAEIMPLTKQYPLAELKKCLLNFRKKTSYRITFEYVMIKNFNLAAEDSQALIDFIGDISCKLNLIAWNKVDYLPYETPDENDIRDFLKAINKLSSAVTFRSSRGADINAACGQLAGQYY
ncbi:MAG: 23S rRNA (adenine(2503)-C2)-methyltransferase [Candidatus Cloacimonas sp. SDB]|nr:MAG: 23S rRNA (adenine(2503)-C2)-methyltransferase [Candidatus Cloacimonas sp. SDB]